jgi:hypothetical protein
MGQAKRKRLAGRERWRVAVHEASHAVALNHYGMLDFVTIDEELATRLLVEQYGSRRIEDDTHHGFTMVKPDMDMRDYCIAIMAGSEGEMLLLPESRKTVKTWASDADELDGVVKDANIKRDHVPALVHAAREEWRRLAKLHNWKGAVIRVAEALLERQTLTAEEVAQIVKRMGIRKS